VAIRYMGTKRHIAPRVRRLAQDMPQRGRFVDLFSGTGSVASQLSNCRSVVTNDVHRFLRPLLSARFTSERTAKPRDALNDLERRFRRQRAFLRDEFGDRLSEERRAVSAGQSALLAYMSFAPHVGVSEDWRKHALSASRLTGPGRYKLTTLYFSSSYLSTSQAIDLDTLRYAIDRSEHNRQDWLVAAWLETVDHVLNAPGHSAQYLKPNSESTFRRIRSVWKRDVWQAFADSLSTIRPLGSVEWRARNEVRSGDSLVLLASRKLTDVGVYYADPPFTRDQYSRYYHLYETLYLYDYPESAGIGRYRRDRFTTPFSLVTQVGDAFDHLFSFISQSQRPLILSYPSDGLLVKAGYDVIDLTRVHFKTVKTHSFQIEHSTMGASKGERSQTKTENLYVCI
jgi:adenine-specific DNA-methyltransferase